MKSKARSSARSKTATRSKPDRLAKAICRAIRQETAGRQHGKHCAQWATLSAVRRGLKIPEDEWGEAIFLGVKKGWLSVDPSLPPHSVCVSAKAPK